MLNSRWKYTISWVQVFNKNFLFGTPRVENICLTMTYRLGNQIAIIFKNSAEKFLYFCSEILIRFSKEKFRLKPTKLGIFDEKLSPEFTAFWHLILKSFSKQLQKLDWDPTLAFENDIRICLDAVNSHDNISAKICDLVGFCRNFTFGKLQNKKDHII